MGKIRRAVAMSVLLPMMVMLTVMITASSASAVSCWSRKVTWQIQAYAQCDGPQAVRVYVVCRDGWGGHHYREGGRVYGPWNASWVTCPWLWHGQSLVVQHGYILG